MCGLGRAAAMQCVCDSWASAGGSTHGHEISENSLHTIFTNRLFCHCGASTQIRSVIWLKTCCCHLCICTDVCSKYTCFLAFLKIQCVAVGFIVLRYALIQVQCHFAITKMNTRKYLSFSLHAVNCMMLTY